MKNIPSSMMVNGQDDCSHLKDCGEGNFVRVSITRRKQDLEIIFFNFVKHKLKHLT